MFISYLSITRYIILQQHTTTGERRDRRETNYYNPHRPLVLSFYDGIISECERVRVPTQR